MVRNEALVRVRKVGILVCGIYLQERELWNWPQKQIHRWRHFSMMRYVNPYVLLYDKLFRFCPWEIWPRCTIEIEIMAKLELVVAQVFHPCILQAWMKNHN